MEYIVFYRRNTSAITILKVNFFVKRTQNRYAEVKTDIEKRKVSKNGNSYDKLK